MGTIIVIDKGGQLVSAVIADSSGGIQPLKRLPGGVFAAIPRLEGNMIVRCRNETSERGGYVTPHVHERMTVDSRSGCHMR